MPSRVGRWCLVVLDDPHIVGRQRACEQERCRIERYLCHRDDVRGANPDETPQTYDQLVCVREARGVAHIGRDKEVVVGELKAFAVCEDRWLVGKDVVGIHLRNWLSVWPVGRSVMCFSAVL